jgi:putative two-component system response regulator
LLLVDDEPSNLHVLKKILQDDYHLLFASDDKKALELSREKQPGLV